MITIHTITMYVLDSDWMKEGGPRVPRDRGGETVASGGELFINCSLQSAPSDIVKTHTFQSNALENNLRYKNQA